jgi:iron complex outermembrane recepter protein
MAKVDCWRRLGLSFFGSLVLGAGSATAIPMQDVDSVDTPVPQVGDLPHSALTVKEWLSQQSVSGTTVPLQVTGVKVNQTAQGLEVVLETATGQAIQTTSRIEGNRLVFDVPNAVLALPGSQTFELEKPSAAVERVTVTQADPTSIRINIIGVDRLPAAQVVAGKGAEVATTPEKVEDDEIEITVTGEQANPYRVPNASTATKTDTPLRDIPQSIQVVPQQLIRDQNLTRLDDALRNVPGVAPDFNSGPYVTYRIRGFEALNNNLLRNGQIDAGAGESVELSNVERIEILKGPASVLFGLGNPGGSINVITKRPLSEPFYAADVTIGSYSFYRGAVDLSGALNDEKTVLYRLNTAYRNSGSFIDFYNSDNLSISPVVSVVLGDRTNLTIEGDYVRTRDSGFTPFVPVVGSVLPNPVGKIPRNRNVGEPTDRINASLIRVGYQLEHKFSDEWSLRNGFLYSFRDYNDNRTLPGTLGADNRTLSRSFRDFDFQSITYNFSTSLIGKFMTGSVQHQLLFGIDLNSYENRVPKFRDAEAAPIDIFNPIYGQPRGEFGDTFSNTTVNNSIGIYLQDQIAFTDNFKVVVGGRFDIIDQRSEDFSASIRSSKSESAFSPRLGIVYQPIPPLSLYASYVSSFTPASGVFLFGGDLSNNAFEPERGRQYEIGIKADLSDRISATLAFFDLTRTNVLTDDPNNPGFQIQTGEQNSRGIELSLGGEILPGWNFIGGYAYTDVRVTRDNTFPVGSQLPNTPDHSFNLWTTYQIQTGDLQGLGFGLGLFFVGDRSGDLPNTYRLPSYLRTDAAIFYKRDRFKIALNFRNLFDVEYFDNGSSATRVNYGQPFTVQGTISWQF